MFWKYYNSYVSTDKSTTYGEFLKSLESNTYYSLDLNISLRKVNCSLISSKYIELVLSQFVLNLDFDVPLDSPILIPLDKYIYNFGHVY